MSRATAVVLVFSVAPVVALGLLALTGGLRPEEVEGFSTAGPVTRFGLPITQAIRDIAALVTVGALVVAATCVPPSEPSKAQVVEGARRKLLDVVAMAASAWLWSGVALLGFTYSEVAGLPLTAPGFAPQVVDFATQVEFGRYLAISSALASIVAVGALRARQTGAVGVYTVTALMALWPIALAGHAAGSLNHNDAVNLQAMHVLGISVWVGGLVAVVLVRSALCGPALVDTVERYSTLAGWCLLLVAISGVLGAGLRLYGPQALSSPYGLVLGAKTAALFVVAAFGWWHRRVGIRHLRKGQSRAFHRIVVVELVVLVAAAGAGVALSRTPPPAPSGAAERLTVAQALLGTDMPEALRAAEWFTAWKPDSFWLPVALLAAGWYVGAVLRLRDRGDRWPLGRTVAWVGGWALFVWATSGAPGVYGRVLFSMHMVQHMTIATAVPTFLVLGAPVTLALRALTRRTDGSRGPREWLLGFVHSWPARILSSAPVAAALFVISLAAFYYSSLFELALRSHTAHLLMTFHFVLTGYLLANSVVGIDPGPRRLAHPFRVLVILVTFGFHALFSVSLMATQQVLAPTWFGVLDRSWGRTLLDDQYLGASLGWALGDYPLAILGVALIVSWVKADRRERRRLDRKADRDGDLDLVRYNEYFARLNARPPDVSGRSSPPTP